MNKHAAPAIHRAQADERATASLVLGILGLVAAALPLATSMNLFLFLFLAALPAFGVVSANRAKKSMPATSPQLGLANAGFALSVIALVIDGFWLLYLASTAGQ